MAHHDTDGDAISSAIKMALKRHPSLAEALCEEIDPTSTALNCAEAALQCKGEQVGIAAQLLLAAEVIRRQQAELIAANWAARTNHDTIVESRR